MALTPAQFKERFQTSLSDEALEPLLAAAYEAIANSDIGPPGDVTELITVGGGDLLILSRPATAIGDVVENGTTLDTTDYAHRTPTAVVRLRTGPHPSWSWRGRVDVTYSVDDDSERDRIAGELVALDLTYKAGLVSVRIGEYSETYGQGDRTYEGERAAILGSYSVGGGAFV